MTRIGLHGAAGHMGRTLIRAIGERDGCTLAGGCERADSPAVGQDLGALAGLPPTGVQVTADAAALCAAADVVVDYSAASATMALLPVVVARGTPLLVCTTGFGAEQQAAMAEAGRSVPLLIGANMSTSVIAMYELVRTAARLLGEEFDIEIFDFHPWDKIDAPSGTALELAHCAAQGPWRRARRRHRDRTAWRDRQAQAGQHRLRLGPRRRRARRELGLLRRPRPASGDHQPGDRPHRVRRHHAGCRHLDRAPAAGLLLDGRHAAVRVRRPAVPQAPSRRAPSEGSTTSAP